MTKDALIEGFKLPHETEEDFLKSVPPIMFEIEEEIPTEADIAWGKTHFTTLELNQEDIKERVDAHFCRVYGCVEGTVRRRKNGYFVRVPCPCCNSK